METAPKTRAEPPITPAKMANGKIHFLLPSLPQAERRPRRFREILDIGLPIVGRRVRGHPIRNVPKILQPLIGASHPAATFAARGSVPVPADPGESACAVHLVDEHQAEQGQGDQVVEVTVWAVECRMVMVIVRSKMSGGRKQRGLEDLVGSGPEGGSDNQDGEGDSQRAHQGVVELNEERECCDVGDPPSELEPTLIAPPVEPKAERPRKQSPMRRRSPG